MASSYSSDIDDVAMSCKGMQLLLNNDLDACQNLFDRYRLYSPLMNGGWSFVSFMRAVISFDDQRLAQAAKDLAESEKLCSNETTSKFTRPNLSADSKTISYEENLTRRIVIADCKLYQAILTLIKQELSGLIGVGLHLRKAWKVYEKLHSELFNLYRTKDSNAEKDYGTKPEDNMVVQFDNTNEFKSEDDGDGDDLSFKSFESIPNDSPDELSLYTIKRLLGSVSFGYGLFQIALSFVPPRIMKVIKFLGFEGDRKAALAALRFSSQSTDMKAPLANLTLLWYHCIIQPFFAIDMSTPPDMSEAKSILKRNIDIYDKSTLFIYFQGRVERLEKDLSKALSTFLNGLNPPNQSKNSTLIRSSELDQILIYDLGFCYLMMLHFEHALSCFIRLKEESRWSKAFYHYTCALCTACMNDPKTSANFVKDGIKSLQKRSNPVELFVQKRLDYLKKNPPSVSSAHILIFEMLYLWILLPLCDKPTLKQILQKVENHGQDSKDDQKLRPITCFLEGVIHNILYHYDDALNCYEEALARAEDSKLHLTRYILPFASCELGILEYIDRQNTERAKELLTKAKEKYSDYDFDNRLQIRATATLKIISSREASATTADSTK
ncbi:unnamed protein product [Adineta steineri]|uniref:Tetratricopeptide repeat protein 39C-like protein n=1 Tax=Adineta steineri TaxID=433720 RepID=A0A814CWM6_9BILA|nr:unnamed protein product [Adineta steineri]CAF4125134.1 unnamed protein product [Adineta steineri]